MSDVDSDVDSDVNSDLNSDLNSDVNNPVKTQVESEVESEVEFDEDLDVRGLNCPLPILKAKKALSNMNGGEILRVTATDPGSVKDFKAFAVQAGHGLLEASSDGSNYVYRLRKAQVVLSGAR